MTRVLFRNAHLLAMDGRSPTADAVLVGRNKIVWVGQARGQAIPQADRVVDCGGATLMPGLHDAHIHFLAYAASLRNLDCGRQAARSIGDIQRLVRERAKSAPIGGWIRGRGYDEFYLAEKRHPNRYDLDAAVSGLPIRLDHRSGHACVLNSAGLEHVGIGTGTPDPTEGVIERDAAGVPTGVLYEMNGYVSQRMSETRDASETREAVAQASNTLLGWGVTSFEDASPENGVGRWDAFRGYQQEGLLQQRVTVMPGIHHLEGFVNLGLRYGSVRPAHGEPLGKFKTGSVESHERPFLRLGHAKIVVTLTTGGLHPPEETLREMVRTAHSLGFPVAVHAIEEEAILAVLGVLHTCSFGVAQDRLGRRDQNDTIEGVRDRVEHCAEATPAVQAMLREADVTVAINPGFIYESGERYRAEVPRARLPWLYPTRSLLDAGIPLAAGSDAPVASPNPWHGIYAAVTRRDASGLALREEQGVSLEEALRLYVGGRAIRADAPADLVLLDRDVTQLRPEELLEVRTTIAG